MIVHLHASCWNEERMLPFFFRHYDKIVDRYFIHDNQSTDGSIPILKSHPKVTILPLVLEGDSVVDAAFAQVNQFWLPSRGEADWVAVCNVDELFWHIDLAWHLRACRKKGITFLGTTGYQMVSQHFPDAHDDLPRTHRVGVRSDRFDKPAFFNPNAITESGFGIARHRCNPKGRVIRAETDEILLLHYKYIGADYVARRHAELNARRRPRDVERRWGHQYDPEETAAIFECLIAEGRQIVPADQGLFSKLRRRWLGPRVHVKAAA